MSKASLELGGGNWGTKDGNLLAYAQGNESSNLVPREFTFTRGSDIAATRINSSGVIEKYRENLLLQSNQFDTTWTSLNASVTGSQAGYDGSSDAWLLENTSNSGRIYQSITTSGVNTFSVYVKAGTTDWVALYGQTSPNQPYVYFDLTNGVVGAKEDYVIHSRITSVGNGWYRISIAFDEAVTDLRIFPAAGNASLGVTGDNIYIQDAQLERGLVATSYLESGATKATSGVADNEPRIDYTGGTASLLLEPSRTNLVRYSELINPTISGLSWAQVNTNTFTTNYGTAPDGTQTSTLIQFATTNSSSQLYHLINFSAGDYTTSIYAKGSGSFKLGIFDNTNVLTDTITLTSEWQRFKVTKTALATSNGRGVWIYPNGDGDTIEIWGGQVEAGSYPTSYIPTYGTSVTRNGENTQLDISSLGITDEFTVFIDTNGALVDGTSLNEMGDIRWYTQTTNRYRFYKSSDLAYISNLIQVDDRTKIALKITASECKTFVDGVLNSTISLTTPFASFDSINRNTETKVKDDLNQISLFSTALTDKEAVDLTSPYSTYQELVTAEGLTWESPTCTTNSITELQSI